MLTATLSPAAGGLSASVPGLVRALTRLDAARSRAPNNGVGNGGLGGGGSVHVVGLTDPDDPAAASGWGPFVHAHAVSGAGTGLRAFGYAPQMAHTLARLAPSLVDVQGLWTYPSLASLRHHRRTGTPYLVTPRGMLDPWARRRAWAKKKAVRLWFEDAHLAGAACLRATAEMEAGHFRSFGLRAPIAIVPNGVSIPQMPSRTGPPSDHRFGPCPDPGIDAGTGPVAGPGIDPHPGHSPTQGRAPGAHRRMLFLSRIHPKKGLPMLLRAWAALAAERPGWELAIAGPDEVGHTAEMQALVHRLGVPRVRWYGAVHGAGKTALYRSAELFVLPTHAENFGLVVAEALAHGVPVVTTRNAPWAALETSRCGWWIPLEQTRLTDTLRGATARPGPALAAMGARGRAWMARDFGWDGIAERMRAVYEWVQHGGPRPACVEA